MAKKKKERRFASSTTIANRRSSGANYGYLKLPSGIQMFTPETETTVVMDIMPYEVTDKTHLDGVEVGMLTFKKPYKVHRRLIGPNKDSEVCPTTFGKPCSICEHRQELLDDGKDWKDPDVSALKPSLRNLYIVKIKEFDGKKKYDKKEMYLFDFSDYYFQDVFEKQLKKKEEWETFFLPEEGCSLEVIFDESKFKSPEATRVDFVARKKQYSDDILDDVPNLDEVLSVLSYDDLDAKFNGEEGMSEEEPKKEKKSKKGKKEKKGEEAPKEEEPKEEKKSKKGKKEKKSKKDKAPKVKPGECPYGHKFGKDCDKYDDCEDCPNWPECKATKKEKKKKK